MNQPNIFPEDEGELEEEKEEKKKKKERKD